jgi:hypothetical protein
MKRKKSSLCNEGCDAPKQFITELKSVYSNEECGQIPDVEFDTPFYDSTLPNKIITIPTKGDQFIIHVPSTSRWAIGQWIYIEGIGKFPIYSHLNATQLVLTNVNDIPEAGKTYAGERKIWITEPVVISESEQAAEELQEILGSSDFDFCAYTKQSNEAETANPIAALLDSALCEPCSGTKDNSNRKRCFRAFKNIVFKWFTIALPSIPRTGLSVATFKRAAQDVNEAIQEIVWHPQYGDFYKRDLPSTNAADSYNQNGRTYALVPSDYASNFYIFGPNASTGKPEWRSFNQPVLKYIGTDMAAGSVNIKTLVEAAIGKSLPNSGEIQVNIWAQIVVTGAASLAQANATANGITIASVRNYDNVGTATRMININLASPTITLANGTSFNLQSALIPASMLLN